MNKNPKKYTSQELKSFQLKDCSERSIYGHEVVDVYCFSCEELFQNKLQNVKNAILHRTGHWHCKSCVGKKGRASNKNSFTKGCRHSSETKKKLKESSKKRWNSSSPEDKKKATCKARAAFLNKHGKQNPMEIESFRQKHRDAINKIFSDEGLNKAIQKKREHTCLEKYGQKYAIADKSVQRKAKEGVQNFHKDDEKKTNSRSKIAETTRERFGHECFFKTDYYLDLKAENNWFISKAETEIREWLESLGFNCKKHNTGRHEIDIFIPEKGIGIEYHGLYWHSEAKRDKNYHLDKLNDALSKNITLIQIFEHEWEYRQSQVKSRLKSLLSLNKKIGARKCSIKDVSLAEARDFINNTHIQGYAKSSIRLGLYYKDELFAIATFGKHHRNNNQLVLNRFCCKDGWTVTGGLSRLSRHALSIAKEPIISWCDLRWSDGNGYEKAGWEKETMLAPDYFYYNKNNRKVISKQSRKKKAVGTASHMTEHEHALADGLLRVYDCGKVRYIIKPQQS